MTERPDCTTETYRAAVGAPLDGTRVTLQNAAPGLRVVLIEQPSDEAAARWARALTILFDAGA